MMLLSVLPPRLYVHCHQFKLPLDLKPGFYSFSLIYLQPLLVYGDMCVVCGLQVCVRVSCKKQEHEGDTIRKLERRRKRERRCE